MLNWSIDYVSATCSLLTGNLAYSTTFSRSHRCNVVFRNNHSVDDKNDSGGCPADVFEL